jgi:hypothetical protein
VSFTVDYLFEAEYRNILSIYIFLHEGVAEGTTSTSKAKTKIEPRKEKLNMKLPQILSDHVYRPQLNLDWHKLKF